MQCLEQFDSHEPSFFCLSISFTIFVIRLYLNDFENLHNLIHLNNVSDTNTIIDDSSISDSENFKSCVTAPSSNVQGNKAKMCDGRLKGKFVSKNKINLSERN